MPIDVPKRAFKIFERLCSGIVLHQGIVLRHCANFEGLSQDHLRCVVRNDEQNSRLIDALRYWQMGRI